MECRLNSSANQVPEGACCFTNFGGALFSRKEIAYKRLVVPWGYEQTAEFAAFNVFNWLKRTYSTWGAGAGEPRTARSPTTIYSSRSTSSKSPGRYWEGNSNVSLLLV